MIKLRAILFLLFLPFWANSQQLTKYRYWYDNDFLSATTVISVNTTINLSLDINSLSFGYHQLNFQSQDANDLWSSISTSTFLKANNVANLNSKHRYWFDNDFTSAITVSSTDTVINLSLNVNTLTDGYHQLNFQTQDANGLWSSILTQSFVKANLNGNNLRIFKYWFDNDFNNAKVKYIGVDSTGDFAAMIDVEGLTDGEHELNYQFSDLRDRWTAVFTDTITKVPITNRNFEYPQIYLDKAQILQGQRDSIWGQKFTNNGQVKVLIKNQSQQTTIADTTIHANSTGKINFIYDFISSLPAGIYYLLAIDQNTQAASYEVRLNVANTGPIVSRDLKVTSPTIYNTSYYTNKPIKIGWSDIPSHISTLIPNTSAVSATYKIEYNKDNSGWQEIATVAKLGYYKQYSIFDYNYTPAQPGSYIFRVTDALDLFNTDISPTVLASDNSSGITITYVWDYSGNRPNIEPLGVAADGTSRIFVGVSKLAGNTKTISNVVLTANDLGDLTSTNTSLLGRVYRATNRPHLLGYNMEANNATTTIASSTTVIADTVWFWYVAPDDFARGSGDNFAQSRYVHLTADVTYTNSTTENTSDKVEIVRPPLMLVHGLGGDEGTWTDFSYLATNGSRRYFVRDTTRWKFVRALNMYPGGSFKQNAQLLLTLTASGAFKTNADQTEHYNINSFQFFLQQMRNKRYACNRVDYVAHSMGGAMGRTALNFYASEFKPTVTMQRKFKNYENGFINKFITLNTPHNGSPLADIVIEKLSQNSIVQKFLQKSYTSGIGLDGFLIRAAFNTIPGTNQLDFDNPTLALQNLQSGSNGVKFNTTVVKNHLIAGNLTQNAENCSDVYLQLLLDDNVKFFPKLLLADAVLTGNSPCAIINAKFLPYGYGDFSQKSDAVVPLSSELPGKNLSGSGNNYTIFNGVSSNHMYIYNLDVVGNKVSSLLNSPINGSSFDSEIERNFSSGSQVYRGGATSKVSDYIDTSKIVISFPQRDTTLSVDSLVTISVKVKDTVNYKHLNMLFQGNIYSSVSKTELQDFNVQVNPFYIGSQPIVASAVYDSSGTDIYYTDTLTVNVGRDSVWQGFYIIPQTKFLNSGQEFVPNYNLIHNTYISNVSIMDSALHINVADTNVVTYSPYLSNFIAKDTGTTYAIISYKQFTDTIFFYIDTASFNPGSPLPVTLLSFKGAPKPVFNLLEWETTNEVNFSHYVLQRSLTGNNWQDIAIVPSVHNTTSSISRYYFNDSLVSNGVTFYRLQMVDIDRTVKISNIIVIRRNDNFIVKVFPNPVTNSELFVDIGNIVTASKVAISIIDISGKEVKNVVQNIQNSNLLHINLGALKPAMYLLKIQSGETIQTFKIVLLK